MATAHAFTQSCSYNLILTTSTVPVRNMSTSMPPDMMFTISIIADADAAVALPMPYTTLIPTGVAGSISIPAATF